MPGTQRHSPPLQVAGGVSELPGTHALEAPHQPQSRMLTHCAQFAAPPHDGTGREGGQPTRRAALAASAHQVQRITPRSPESAS